MPPLILGLTIKLYQTDSGKVPSMNMREPYQNQFDTTARTVDIHSLWLDAAPAVTVIYCMQGHM